MARKARRHEALTAGPFLGSQVRSEVPRHALRTQQVVSLGRDVFVPAGSDLGVEARAQALGLVLGPQDAFSHATAARLLGLAVPAAARWRTELVHVSTRSTSQPHRRRGVRSYCVELPPAHLVVLRGLPLTKGARTFVDLAATGRLDDLVAVGDQLLRRGLARREDLSDLLAWGTGRRGVRLARQALPLLDPGAESVPESRVRVALVLAGLPRPEANGWIEDPHGRPCYRGDLVYRAWRVVVEYDGGHHRDADQFAADLRRRNDLTRWGWVVVHVEARQLGQPRLFTGTVRAALRSRGWRPGAVLRES